MREIVEKTIFGEGRCFASNFNYYTALGYGQETVKTFARKVVMDIRLGVPPDEARQINMPPPTEKISRNNR